MDQRIISKTYSMAAKWIRDGGGGSEGTFFHRIRSETSGGGDGDDRHARGRS